MTGIYSGSRGTQGDILPEKVDFQTWLQCSRCRIQVISHLMRISEFENNEQEEVDTLNPTEEMNSVENDTMNQKQNTLESRLLVGSIADGPDAAYVLYCEYGREKGFSVKKGTQSYFRKTDITRMKLFHCSCEGKTDDKATINKVPKFRKQHFRTDCRAKLRIVRDTIDGPWSVNLFETDHNHPLLAPVETYLLRSSRNLTMAKRSELESFNLAGIGVSRAFRFIENAAGGKANVGFTRKDAYDHMSKMRSVSKIQNYDAHELLKYFQSKSENEPYFFWRVSLDDDGRLMHFFSRDCRSADDYVSFGDVLSVDTTFKTNKYNLICAPLVGLNHHRLNILFGIGFLSDETTESFEWLFKTFLESMEGKEPGIIMSDQDQALINAIDTIFKEAVHRLCQWHIGVNAKSHFGRLNNDSEFRSMWFKCMNGYESESEFVETWKTMIRKYGLEENRWFANMFNIRATWADVYVNDKFTVGLRATSRSESTNKVIKDLCESSSSLCEFVRHYEGIINEWRHKERDEDVANYGIPGLTLDDNPILASGATIYTRNIYHLFEKEAVGCLNVKIINTMIPAAGGAMCFTMSEVKHQGERVVSYNSLSREVSCTCCMLVTHGYFCRHILKVYYTLNVTTLPEQYLLKRWTKEAKHRNLQSWTNQMLSKEREPNITFRNTLLRMAYDLSKELEDNILLHGVAREKFLALMMDLKKMKEPTTQVKRNPRQATKVKKTKKFKDPPLPQHGWLPAKRRSTILDKPKIKKGATKLKKGPSGQAAADQTEGSQRDTCDDFLFPIEDLGSPKPPSMNFT